VTRNRTQDVKNGDLVLLKEDRIFMEISQVVARERIEDQFE
jgi:hypothetical protein